MGVKTRALREVVSMCEWRKKAETYRTAADQGRTARHSPRCQTRSVRDPYRGTQHAHTYPRISTHHRETTTSDSHLQQPIHGLPRKRTLPTPLGTLDNPDKLGRTILPPFPLPLPLDEG